MKSFWINDDELHRALSIYCAKKGISLRNALENSIREFLENHNDPASMDEKTMKPVIFSEVIDTGTKRGGRKLVTTNLSLHYNDKEIKETMEKEKLIIQPYDYKKISIKLKQTNIGIEPANNETNLLWLALEMNNEYLRDKEREKQAILFSQLNNHNAIIEVGNGIYGKYEPRCIVSKLMLMVCKRESFTDSHIFMLSNYCKITVKIDNEPIIYKKDLPQDDYIAPPLESDIELESLYDESGLIIPD